MSKNEWGDCPICKKEITTWPALSRRDNKTDICSKCGLLEGLDDFLGKGSDRQSINAFTNEELAEEIMKEWKQPKQEGNNNE